MLMLKHFGKFGSANTIESFLFEKKIPFRNVIKLYLLKLLFQIHFNDYYKFQNEIGKENIKIGKTSKVFKWKIKKKKKKMF